MLYDKNTVCSQSNETKKRIFLWELQNVIIENSAWKHLTAIEKISVLIQWGCGSSGFYCKFVAT